MTMAVFPNKFKSNSLITSKSANILKEKLRQALGVCLLILGIALFSLLISYDPSDPSFRSATNASAQNVLGAFGSYMADSLYLAIGTSSYVMPFILFFWGWRFLLKKPSNNFILKIIMTPLLIAFLSMFLAAHPAPSHWSYSYGLGGVFGDNGLSLILELNLVEISNWLRIITILLGFCTVSLLYHILGFTKTETRKIINIGANSLKYGLNGILSSILTLKYKGAKASIISKPLTAYRPKESIFANGVEDRIRTKINDVLITRKNNATAPGMISHNDEVTENMEVKLPSLGGFTKTESISALNTFPTINTKNSSLFSRVQKNDVRKINKSAVALKEEQPTLQFESSQQDYTTPALSLLENASTIVRNNLSDDALNENARMLENVLDDYGVKGEIVSVRPGPVVTLYELEPAAGLKASRVIGLSDDIARSMSALSARVSTIPGRSVIGIELPNSDREKVLLREILSSRAYGDSKFQLPLALGKDIGGETIVTNLARMPHLLIAGTTGSGKSVGINTMILSLLYSLTPDQCRLIMIDPKMLELSVYDGIPHLLSPVVTDPKKAVVALKWAVSEMEERYRKMSKMGVRNIDGFNARVEDALTKNENFSRTVQTGFDEQSGDPTFETEYFTPKKIPYIVIVVDEMADLMMVAGKEIEACIQRLAQMARAAGIHLIMATQRPSVDVITGTIKANFPSRISFQVTSKIDSRTILGEMGAEQLLGMGDMLYMTSNGRITRIHGPFVSDEEVEDIVTFLKSQGAPEYVSGVVESPDSDAEMKLDQTLGLSPSDSDSENVLYDQAVAIVAHDRKCSTSYIQRKLSIGYNRAAKIVETMEEQGIVSQANHVGKREILIPEN